MVNEQIMNLREAAEYLKLSMPVVAKETKKGNIKGVKIGRQYRFLKSELDKVMQGAI